MSNSYIHNDLYNRNMRALKIYIEETRDMIKAAEGKVEYLDTRVSQLEEERDALKTQVQTLLVKVYSGAATGG